MRHELFAPLTAGEISAVARLVRGAGVGERPGFSAVFTDEPDKALLRAGTQVPRRARAMVVDRSTGRSYDVRIDLDAQSVESADVVAHGAAPVLLGEFESVAAAVKKDRRYLDALARRGIGSAPTRRPWSRARAASCGCSRASAGRCGAR
ncbi:hypothetical protein ACWEPC_46335 [Nonomuraea sp. NPDC004297]